MITMSQSRAFAALTVSNTTAAGSAPSECLTSSTPARPAQTPSWSIAAARKVSAAPKMTRLPSALYIAASLPMVVVLPTPLTPMTSTTLGTVTSPISSPPSKSSATISLISFLTASAPRSRFSETRFFKRSVISTAVTMPTSPITRISSSSAYRSSVISPPSANRLSMAPAILLRVLESPKLILLKMPMRFILFVSFCRCVRDFYFTPSPAASPFRRS